MKEITTIHELNIFCIEHNYSYEEIGYAHRKFNIKKKAWVEFDDFGNEFLRFK